MKHNDIERPEAAFELQETVAMAAGPNQRSGGSYLLVFGEGAAQLVPLPPVGSRLIGRSSDADITVEDPSLAENHAIIELDEAGASVLCVAGETKVNDELVKKKCEIRSGDVLTLGAVSLGFHGLTARTRERNTLSLDQMRRRLIEETERFLRYRRPLAVLVVRTKPPRDEDVDALLQAATRAVRVVDVVAWDGRREFWFLFPETSETAMIPAQRVLTSILKAAEGATGGLARCPFDGIDPEALISGARTAAKEASPGTIVAVSDANHSMLVGEREVVAADPLMRSMFELIRRIASSEIPVLIMGETGAGKEIVAQAVHAWSKRANSRMVSINCAAVPETLLESELFGHDKGAFTGATTTKAGLFEEASGGTVFLDEIGECSPRTQAELLRVLETKKFCRVGSLRERNADVRIVAATNRPLENEIQAGRFRQDLFFRLNTATVTVPPLRDRPLDLPVLARTFLRSGCEREDRKTMALSSSAMQRILLHDWPGNVREIRNLMDFLAATVQGTVVEDKDLPPTVAAKIAPWMLPKPAESNAAPKAPSQTPRSSSTASGANEPRKFRNLYDEIRELEKTRIQEALEEAEGVRNRAAELIGMPLRTLVTKIKLYGLGPAPPRSRGPSKAP